ncbi:unnamed protein product [Protopolystoma xenopodis]|uniref:Uncharacterized protein n=1 Tax=Protopolystoma xenopodis TaxID=117903 RepID=A0A3S5BAH8_9PLAT|nr:unnamed protein product [Protopolystoma xenopodis]
MPAKRLRMYHVHGPTLEMIMPTMDSGQDAFLQKNVKTGVSKESIISVSAISNCGQLAPHLPRQKCANPFFLLCSSLAASTKGESDPARLLPVVPGVVGSSGADSSRPIRPTRQLAVSLLLPYCTRFEGRLVDLRHKRYQLLNKRIHSEVMYTFYLPHLMLSMPGSPGHTNFLSFQIVATHDTPTRYQLSTVLQTISRYKSGLVAIVIFTFCLFETTDYSD